MHAQAGRLRAARDRLIACARPICERFIRRQCTQRFSNIESEVPSVIPLVNDELGKPMADARVAIDDEAADSPADGRAIPVDPGRHHLTFSAGGEVIAREDVLILQGQHNRALEVSLKMRAAPAAPPPPPPEPPPPSARPQAVAADTDGSQSPSSAAGSPLPTRRKGVRVAQATGHSSRRSFGATPRLVVREASSTSSSEDAAPTRPTLAYALAGLGLAAGGAGALFTYWGRADNNRLAACSPACPQTSVDHVHRLYVGADVALGVGAALIAAATWAYLRHDSRERASSEDTALRLDVRPTTSGALAALRGSF